MCHDKFKSRMKAQNGLLKNISIQQRWYGEHVCCRRKTCANNFGEIIIFIAYRFCLRNYNHLEAVFIHVRLRLICCYCMSIDRLYCQRNLICWFNDKASLLARPEFLKGQEIQQKLIILANIYVSTSFLS